jgi:RNA polymerase sigma-70 factor (ECF subfamily)
MAGLGPSGNEVTRMLRAWSGGDASALERLTPLVYAELHRLAQRGMAREKGGHVLQPSALVNEAFVRLIGGVPVVWESRTHFFALSSRLMRQILVDFARARDSRKRGEGNRQVTLSGIELQGAAGSHFVDFIDLDSALEDLGRLDDRQAKVVELRYFGGLENGEIARILGISEPTVVRDWRLARAFLFERLQPHDHKQ